MASWERRARRALSRLFLKPDLSLASHTDAPELRDRHRQPEPLDTAGMGHFAVMPAPQSALKILEPALDPGAQPIPTDQGFLCFEVGEDDPGRLVAPLPIHQKR